MERFCKAVINFLQSEYGDAYEFSIERYMALPPEFNPFHKERLELKIKLGRCYYLTIVNESMQYLFKLFCSGEFLEDRGQYLWQKELTDMIEGG